MRKERPETSEPRRRSWFRRYRRYSLVVSLLISATLWFAFQHKPGWYRPVEVNEEIIQRARRDVPNLVDWISGHLVRRESVEFTLHERAVNEWLSALPHAWPEASDAIPPEVSGLAVRFTADGIRAGGHMTSSGWEVIIGVTLNVSLIDDGAAIKVTLIGLRGGSLPLPNFLIRPILNRALSQQARENPVDAEGSGDVVPLFESADDLFNGLRFENRFEWPNGKRLFKVGRISFGEGKVVIQLEPL